MKSNVFRPIMLAAAAELALAASASAHKGYMTTYSHHIEAGEVEVMLLSDFASPSKAKREADGHGDYVAQMFELKYNPTRRLALEFMWEWFRDAEKGNGKFTGFRYETRYQLFPVEVPLNPMVYAEFESLHPSTRYKMETSGWIEPPYEETAAAEPGREKIMESRLILSQDFGPWNAAFNWINESDLQSGRSAFGYTTGVFHRIGAAAAEGHAAHAGGSFVRPVAVSFELFGALGDDRRFGLTPSRQEHYIQPGITFHVGGATMLTAGYAIGLSRSSDDMVRLNTGWRF